MFDADQLRCERCGGTQFAHFREDAEDGEERWWNRCRSCGAVSEYMPTLEEIRRECARIRAEQNAFEVTDATEKFWRNQQDQLAARRGALPEDDSETGHEGDAEQEAA